MTPTRGSPHTAFRVSFVAPDRTGTIGGLRRHYVVEVSAGTRRTGCTSNGSAGVPPSAAQAHVQATLDPKRLGGPWCAGTFNGKVVELQAPNCAAGQVCPAYVVIIGTVGRFSFRVA